MPLKAEIFDINKKKEYQRLRESRMTPRERLELTLDLMDLSLALSKDKNMPLKSDDNIEWIELKYAHSED